MSRTFVDVGVRRIGDYITRVPRLAMIRGASAMVSEATREDAILAMLAAAGVTGVRRNEDVGEADGVVHLEVTGSQDPALVAQHVLTHLRTALPGADLGASWGTGRDYASAFAQIRAMSAAGDGLEWFGATAECAWLNPCTSCGVRAALGGGPEAECDDCRGRGAAARTDRGGIADRLAPDLDFAARELSHITAPPPATAPASNHIALVTADGNGVGALFDRLVKLPDVTAEQRRRISLGLSAATAEAFRSAALAVEQDRRVRVVPVLHGGDDVSAFVGADLAWPFTLALLASFDEAANAMVGSVVGAEAAQSLPHLSMSAGLVFCKVKFPAADAFRVSSALMKRAKRDSSGKLAAVSWLDVTADGVPVGDDPAAGRPVVAVAALSALDGPLRDVGLLRASSRKRMQEILGDIDEIGVSAADAVEYSRLQARRVGAEDAVAPFLAADATIALPTALDLARWWS